MTATSQPSDGMPFSRDDIQRLIDAKAEIKRYEQFVLSRFLRFTQMGLAKTARTGKTVEPQAAVRDPSGWSTWRVRSGGLFPQNGDTIAIERYTADDRGPGTVGEVVEIPLSFVFNETGADERYEDFLRMKAEFEGDGNAA